MKISFNKDKFVVLEAEFMEESFELMKAWMNTETPSVRGDSSVAVPIKRVYRKHKPHKKHSFIKQCDICGKGYKGNIGLAVHKSDTHGQKSNSPAAEYYRQRKARGLTITNPYHA